LERARVLHTEDEWSFWDAIIVAVCLECGEGSTQDSRILIIEA